MISRIDLFIAINYFLISRIDLLISIIHLLISIIHLLISRIRFIDNNKSNYVEDLFFVHVTLWVRGKKNVEKTAPKLQKVSKESSDFRPETLPDKQICDKINMRALFIQNTVKH